ncbi:MAG: hypothetical protein JWL61_1239 [Gemmatimonadetes bacterium]|nr:hypothetical protein [Gemmatimonadota bacterium]
MLHERLRTSRSPKSRRNEGDDIGPRLRIGLEHAYQSPFTKIARDRPLRPHHDAEALKRPLPHDLAVIAGESGFDSNRYGLAIRRDEAPQRHVLIILADRDARQSPKIRWRLGKSPSLQEDRCGAGNACIGRERLRNERRIVQHADVHRNVPRRILHTTHPVGHMQLDRDVGMQVAELRRRGRHIDTSKTERREYTQVTGDRTLPMCNGLRELAQVINDRLSTRSKQVAFIRERQTSSASHYQSHSQPSLEMLKALTHRGERDVE